MAKASEVTTVYWAPLSQPARNTSVNLLWAPPKKLFKTLPPRHEALNDSRAAITGDYYACKASQKLFNNTYVFYHPLTSTVKFEGQHWSPNLLQNDYGMWIPRSTHFEEVYSAEYDAGWLFFSDKPLEMRMTPPYFHKTKTSQEGCIMPGTFDIGQWYRAAMMTHQLWPGNDTLTVHEGDPCAYVEFVSDTPVVLKQYELTEELWNISLQATNFKSVIPNQSLVNLYERFTRSGRRNRVLALIKANLV